MTASRGSLRVVLLLCTLGGALLLAEGALSLLAGRSLRELVLGAPLDLGARAPAPGDAELRAAPRPGPYAFHVDARVGLVCAPDSTVEILGAPVVTDDLGMRVRPGPPAGRATRGGEPLRVVVLGDSVAFGFGVRDDETLAAQLEDVLATALPERAVECRTVALPGWNHRNAVAFLLDHLDRYPADLVLYVPIGNDLVDGYSVRESGFRREAPDPAAADPWLGVSTDRIERFVIETGRRMRADGRTLSRDAAGTDCVGTDLVPESSRRYDENAASIALLDEQVRRRGGALVLLQFSEEAYTFILWDRLLDAGLALPVVPLFVAIPPGLQLPDDPHPSPLGLRVMARWTARSLAAFGLVPGLSPDDVADDARTSAWDEARAPTRDAAAWRAEADAARDRARRLLLPEFDPRTGRGVFQVVGGVNPDATFGLHGLLVLRSAGDVLALGFEPLPGRPDLDGLVVDVSVAGLPAGRVTLAAGRPTAARLPLPDGAPRDAPVEVFLRAERAVVTEYAGRAQTAAYRLVRAAFER